MAFFFLLMFLLMITFGGIAIDVMRFETRRVAMQQTLDRAALAAASLTQSRTPKQVVDDYFAKADLASGLDMVEFGAPTVTALTDAGLRRVSVAADVTSQNFFMTIFSKNDFLAGPASTEAAQGVSQIEVMMVLDITGSMAESAGGGKTKIQALREYAQEFVTIVKNNDKKDGVSIGVVPFSAQVNIPEALRKQFTGVENVSSWDNVVDKGVWVTGGTESDINCFEFPTSSFTSTGFPTDSVVRMAAVVDTKSTTTTTTDIVAPQAPVATQRACTVKAETTATAWRDADMNKVLLPTKNAATVTTKLARLAEGGNTYTAVGMRWGTALIDETARPIYTNLLSGEAGMAGRPANNNSIQTRKIIILMTDGDHVTNDHIVDAFKSGPSPIWRGTDGNFAIRYTSGGPALTGGTRPTACSGWTLGTDREYFVPHLKRNSVKQKKLAAELEGQGTGTATSAACDPLAWVSKTTWATKPGWGSYDANGVPLKDAKGNPIFVPATQLDWSEVWRFLRVSWVARQLYMRSGVTGTTNYNTLMGTFRATYLTSTANMDSLLQQNCGAARTAGIEIYGIAFGETISANGQKQIKDCSSSPEENYYFFAKDGDKLRAAFKAIATDISELRLTQ